MTCPTYNGPACFETFPFPTWLTPNLSADNYVSDPRAEKIAQAAKRLNGFRENWLNSAELVRREPEVVPGSPSVSCR